MGTLNEASLVEKLGKLNSSQASINTLSEWCVFYRSDSGAVVKTWIKEFHKSPSARQLAFVYLANDILQKSRKKGPEFVSEFIRVLPQALSVLATDEATRQKLQRLVGVWDERKVFGSHGQIEVIKDSLKGGGTKSPRSGPPAVEAKEPRYTAEGSAIAAAITKVKSAQPANEALLARCEAVAQGKGTAEDQANINALMAEYSSRVAKDVQRREALISNLKKELEAQELDLALSKEKLMALEGGDEDQGAGGDDNGAAEVAARLAASEASASVLAQALAELPSEERDQFGRGVVHAISAGALASAAKRART